MRCLSVRSACLALLVVLVAASAPAVAKTHAVLIGASTYRNLPPDKSLRAPANDVRRMRDALRALGVAPHDIALYADGVEGSLADPTAAVIEQVFDALPPRIGAGDHVVIYLSGHGTQIPDDNGDEDDGFDEAFLPVDAIPPPAGAERFDMTNVIRDDRIGELVDALRDERRPRLAGGRQLSLGHDFARHERGEPRQGDQRGGFRLLPPRRRRRRRKSSPTPGRPAPPAARSWRSMPRSPTRYRWSWRCRAVRRPSGRAGSRPSPTP